ncbi:MAG: HD domain-containing protein [Acidobacteriota bacterium]
MRAKPRTLADLDFHAVIRADPVLADLAREARTTSIDLLLVGGAVRDLFLGRTPEDLDFVLVADSQPARDFLTGRARAYGTRLLVFDRKGIRERRLPLPGRELDFVIVPPGRLEPELARRDFTVNTLAVRLPGGMLLDRFQAREDLRRGILRQVGPDGFLHDPLRALRAVRLLAWRTVHRIEAETAAELRRRARGLASCAAERIGKEMDRIAGSNRFAFALRTMGDLGLLEPLLPEAIPMFGVTQNAFHHLDCWEHTLAAVDLADDLSTLAAPLDQDGLPPFPLPGGEDLLVLKYGLLMHDLGKPATRSIDGAGRVHFYGHEKVSVKLARGVARRWCFSRRRMDRVATLIRNHLRPGALGGQATEKALRRLIHDLDGELDLLLLLSLADTGATRGQDDQARRAGQIAVGHRLRSLWARLGDELTRPRLLLDGHEVMHLLGLPPGRQVGRILAALERLQVEGRVIRRDQAVVAIRRLGASLRRR